MKYLVLGCITVAITLAIFVLESLYFAFHLHETVKKADEEHKRSWGISTATTESVLTWEPDPWAAAAVQVIFDECEFDSVRIVRSTTIATEGTPTEPGGEPAHGRYMYRVCPLFGETGPGRGPRPPAPDDMEVVMSVMQEMDWRDIGLLAWAPQHQLPPKVKSLLKGHCANASGHDCDSAEPLDPVARDPHEKSRDSCQGVFAKVKLNDFPRDPDSWETCYMMQKLRPYSYSLLLWLHRRLANPAYCNSTGQQTKHPFVLEALALQPWNGTCSLEYTWDGQISSILLAVWATVRWLLSIRPLTPWMPTACDLYCCAYIISIVAWLSMEFYVPQVFVAKLQLAGKFCSIMAEVTLALGVSRTKLQNYRTWCLQFGNHVDDESLNLPQSEACPQVMLCLVLWASALAPVMQAQSPPGFSACADGGDPRVVPERTSSMVRWLPFAFAIPWVCRMYSSGIRRHLITLVLYLAGPMVAWAITLNLAHYVQRKVQLIVALLLLRTVGAIGLILESGNEAGRHRTGGGFSTWWQQAALIPLLIVIILICTLCSGLMVTGTFAPRHVAAESHSCLWDPSPARVASHVQTAVNAGPTTIMEPAEDIADQQRRSPAEEAQKAPEAKKAGAGKASRAVLAAQQALANLRKQKRRDGSQAAPPAKVMQQTTQESEEDSEEDVITCFSQGERETAVEGWLDANPCEDIRPDILDGNPELLHVLFTSDSGQLPGLQASVASVLMSAKNPKLILVHIVVLPDELPRFKQEFGMHQDCSRMITGQGAHLRFHAMDEELLSPVRSNVPPDVLAERGAIDSFENYVRFYIHLLIEEGVVVYLDADTVVRKDLNALRAKLLESNVTIGFIRRPEDKLVQMKSILKLQKSGHCTTNWSKHLLELPAYNAGVFVVNVQRWRHKAVTKRVEALVQLHNNCTAQGGLWIGGSQPPLLLAFLDHGANGSADYIDFESSWNAGELGWRKGISSVSIENKSVLHWNGNLKPWLAKGLYRNVWQPYCTAFTKRLQPQLKQDGLPRTGVGHKISFFPRQGDRRSGWYLDMSPSDSLLLHSTGDGPTPIGNWVLEEGSAPGVFSIKSLSTAPPKVPQYTPLDLFSLKSSSTTSPKAPQYHLLDLDGDSLPANATLRLEASSPERKQTAMWALEEGVIPGLFKLRFVPGDLNPDRQMPSGYLDARPMSAATHKNEGDSTSVIVHELSSSSDAGDWMFEPAEEHAARAACPHVSPVLELRSKDAKKKGVGKGCHFGKTYGCLPGDLKEGLAAGMWTVSRCRGIFKAYGAVTSCGGSDWGRRWIELPEAVRRSLAASHPGTFGADRHAQIRWCPAGMMPEPQSRCQLMILTSFFTTKQDWQRQKYVGPQFKKIQGLYRSVLELGLNVTVVYDELPAEIIQRFGCDRFNFLQVDLKDFDSAYGVNDVRFFFFDRILREHADWKYVFFVDGFDVKVAMNPCLMLDNIDDGYLYVGVERDNLKGYPWMVDRFNELGGHYLDWYKEETNCCMKILNAGIIGGRWDTMLRLLKHIIAVMSDPLLGPRLRNESINQNMAALNYVAYKSFPGFIGGSPLHSRYKMYENHRRDVAFIHK